MQESDKDLLESIRMFHSAMMEDLKRKDRQRYNTLMITEKINRKLSTKYGLNNAKIQTKGRTTT